MTAQNGALVNLEPARIRLVHDGENFNVGTSRGSRDSVEIYQGKRSRIHLVDRHGAQLQVGQAATKPKRKRLRKIGKVVLPVLGIALPPLGVMMLIGWGIHRSRPHNKARRLAKRALTMAETNPNAALPLLEEAHVMNPKDDQILATAGYVAHNAEDYKMAWRFLGELRRHNKLSPAETLLLGHSYYRTGHLDKAISTLQEIPEDFEHSTKASLVLAGCFAAKEDYEAARDVLEHRPARVLNMDDDMKELEYQLGVINTFLGNEKEANEHFRRLYAADIRYRDIRERVAAQEALATSAPPPALPPATSTISTEEADILTRIRALADLHAEGILTDDEFTTKKAELLARI